MTIDAATFFWDVSQEEKPDDLTALNYSKSDLISWLDQRDVRRDMLKPLDLELFRYNLEWAEKSAQTKEEVSGVYWNQSEWASLRNHDDLEFQRVTTEAAPYIGGDSFIVPRSQVKEGFCDTTGCFAGNVAIDRGDVLWSKNGDGSYGALWVLDSTGPRGVRSIEDFARRELKITTLEASLLFAGSNEIEELAFYGEGFAERRGQTL